MKLTNSIFLTLLLLVLTLSAATGQNARSLINDGKKELKKQNYKQALDHFQKALEIESSNDQANYYAGVCRLTLGQPELALEHLLKADKMTKEKKYNYHLARAYFQNEQFNQAGKFLHGSESSKITEEEAKLYENLRNAQNLVKHPLGIIVQNLGDVINTPGGEYSAMMTADQRSILFTSRRSESAKQAADGLAYENIYSATMDKFDEWQTPETIDNHANSKGHDASVQLFAADQKMVIYHNEDLFLTEYEEGAWGKRRSLDMLNNDKTLESHCFINATEDIIYFASDRHAPGGDLDLYVTIKGDNGKWGDPESLETLNTPFDEDAPFLGEDGTLYLSSRGHNSMGGYDIFRSRHNPGSNSWQSPQNVGYPINSVFDDIYFNTIGNLAYFSSQRKGGYGFLDIYRIILFDKVKIPGVVINKANNQLVSGASISIYEVDKPYKTTSNSVGNCQLIVPIEQSFNLEITVDGELVHSGEYLMRVLFKDPKKHQYNLSIEISPGARGVEPTTSETQHIITTMSYNLDWELGQLVPVDIDPERGLVLRINLPEPEPVEALVPAIMEIPTPVAAKPAPKSFAPVYFDYNQTTIRQDDLSELDRVAQAMTNDQEMKLLVEAYADVRGTDWYNVSISGKRAQAVKNYLVGKGVDRSRLELHGNGESNLVNDCVNGVPCPDSKHQQNRRVIFTVASVLNKPGELVLMATLSGPSAPLSEVDRYSWMVENYVEKRKEGLQFKVTLGAFKEYTDPNFERFVDLGSIEKAEGDDGMVRFHISGFPTLKHAEIIRQEVINRGIEDAYVAIFYNQKRIGLKVLSRL